MASLTSVAKAAATITKNPFLIKIFSPAAKIFTSYSGYRQMGLKLDDILIEETPVMQKAISRLPASESYARNYRILTAHQLSLSHHVLSAAKSVKPEEDDAYLTPYILQAEFEAQEKEELDNAVFQKA
ncbi:unnamed protein product [Kuraishia capsulata CBS 1993]|uniref:Cytochrome b-c1 complex subunit 7 n=1 Tax=Kuraishia capsulata CBS 1993 TaxID=1382522 RepID=W6MLC3_9ASCO|nr:uncharacterized protein KUCA_T00002883001 [Kuraishia capsulata CBS 1993]CDK26908.1 unnamed protein product [Kuraishia capsulata CBS 1993]